MDTSGSLLPPKGLMKGAAYPKASTSNRGLRHAHQVVEMATPPIHPQNSQGNSTLHPSYGSYVVGTEASLGF